MKSCEPRLVRAGAPLTKSPHGPGRLMASLASAVFKMQTVKTMTHVAKRAGNIEQSEEKKSNPELESYKCQTIWISHTPCVKMKMCFKTH